MHGHASAVLRGVNIREKRIDNVVLRRALAWVGHRSICYVSVGYACEGVVSY